MNEASWFNVLLERAASQQSSPVCKYLNQIFSFSVSFDHAGISRGLEAQTFLLYSSLQKILKTCRAAEPTQFERDKKMTCYPPKSGLWGLKSRSRISAKSPESSPSPPPILHPYTSGRPPRLSSILPPRSAEF